MGDEDAWMKGLRGFIKAKPKLLDLPPSSPPLRATLDTLPEELVLAVAANLAPPPRQSWSTTTPRFTPDLGSLRAVCRYLRTIVTPLFFRTVALTSDTRVDSLYELVNGDMKRYFLGPPDNLPPSQQELWAMGIIPITDVAPGPHASTLLMHSIRHLTIGPRKKLSMTFDLRFILQLLPNLQDLELYESRDDGLLDRNARVLRAHVPNLRRFVYAFGGGIRKFSTRNPFARALGDKESLREVELMSLNIGEAPWLMPEDVGLEQDWKAEDSEKLGMDSRVVWYRPKLVIEEKQVRLPGKLTALRLRSITFDKPETETPPPQTIALLREHAPHLLGLSAKGKDKEDEEHVWSAWPPAVHPFVRLLRCSASTLTELGLEGVYGEIPYSTIEYAMREIGPRLTKLCLRRYGRVAQACTIVAMCTQLQWLMLDDNGANKVEGKTLDLLRAVPETTQTLELWPDFNLHYVLVGMQEGILKVRVVDLSCDRWSSRAKVTKNLITEGEKCGIEVVVGDWYNDPSAPTVYSIREEDEEEDSDEDGEEDDDE